MDTVVLPDGTEAPVEKSRFLCSRCGHRPYVSAMHLHFLGANCRAIASLRRWRKRGYCQIGDDWRLIRGAVPDVEVKVIRQIFSSDCTEETDHQRHWSGYVPIWAKAIVLMRGVSAAERRAALTRFYEDDVLRSAVEVEAALQETSVAYPYNHRLPLFQRAICREMGWPDP